jgi:hypothetical protein
MVWWGQAALGWQTTTLALRGRSSANERVGEVTTEANRAMRRSVMGASPGDVLRVRAGIFFANDTEVVGGGEEQPIFPSMT